MRYKGITHSSDGQGELRHGVKSAWASVDELLDEAGDGSASSPISAESLDLLDTWNFAGEQEPEETLGKGFFAAGSLGQELLDLGDGLATEADTLLGVKDRAVPQ